MSDKIELSDTGRIARVARELEKNAFAQEVRGCAFSLAISKRAWSAAPYELYKSASICRARLVQHFRINALSMGSEAIDDHHIIGLERGHQALLPR